MATSPSVQQGGGQVPMRDGVGPGMEQAPEPTGVGTQDVAPVVEVVEDLGAEPIEVDDRGREAGRFELGLELGERRPRRRRAGSDPLERGGSVAGSGPQPGVEEPPAGVEDVGVYESADGAEL